ncbi:unnamed protein product [Lampetra planeri]
MEQAVPPPSPGTALIPCALATEQQQKQKPAQLSPASSAGRQLTLRVAARARARLPAGYLSVVDCKTRRCQSGCSGSIGGGGITNNCV